MNFLWNAMATKRRFSDLSSLTREHVPKEIKGTQLRIAFLNAARNCQILNFGVN